MINLQISELDSYPPHIILAERIINEEDFVRIKRQILRGEINPYISEIDESLYEYLYKEDINSPVFKSVFVNEDMHRLFENQELELIRTGILSAPLSCLESCWTHIPTTPEGFKIRLATSVARNDNEDWSGNELYIPTGFEEEDRILENEALETLLVCLVGDYQIIPLIRKDNENNRYIYYVLDFNIETKEQTVVKIAVSENTHNSIQSKLYDLYNRYCGTDTNISIKGYAENLIYFYYHLEELIPILQQNKIDVVAHDNIEQVEEIQEVQEQTEIIENEVVASVIKKLPVSNINNIRRRLGIPIDETIEITELEREENEYGDVVVKQAYIPVNSEILTYKEHTSRFSGAIWFNKILEMTVTLAGLGGIGSYVAFLLSRLNIGELIVYDDDIVDVSNMSGQLYGSEDVGLPKVASVYNMAREFSYYYRVSTRRKKFEETDFPTDIMICGFDNMAARKTYYEVWKEHVNMLNEEHKKNCLFIDGRLSTEDFQVLCIVGNHPIHRQRYEEKYLFSDAEADQTVCSYKQTSFCANMIASTMVNLFVNFVANLCHPIINRAVPFYTEYDGQFMTFNTSY